MRNDKYRWMGKSNYDNKHVRKKIVLFYCQQSLKLWQCQFSLCSTPPNMQFMLQRGCMHYSRHRKPATIQFQPAGLIKGVKRDLDWKGINSSQSLSWTYNIFHSLAIGLSCWDVCSCLGAASFSPEFWV